MDPTNPRILIVDDEPSIRNLLHANLEGNGFATEMAENGTQALAKAVAYHPHLVILDLGLPDIDGLEVLKQLRAWTTIPIVILTVVDDERKKVQLLDAGADDYLTKPFSIPELLARVRVGIRRHNAMEATPVFISGELQVDLNQRKVSLSGTTVRLTATEFELLSLLVRSYGKVIPQGQLLKAIWGANAMDQSHYLRIYIGQLRKKIEIDPSSPKHILTDPGVGYKVV